MPKKITLEYIVCYHYFDEIMGDRKMVNIIMPFKLTAAVMFIVYLHSQGIRYVHELKLEHLQGFFIKNPSGQETVTHAFYVDFFEYLKSWGERKGK